MSCTFLRHNLHKRNYNYDKVKVYLEIPSISRTNVAFERKSFSILAIIVNVDEIILI